MAVETGLTPTCLLTPWMKQEEGAGPSISKGGAQGQYPVMEIEKRIKKKVLNISLGVVQTRLISLAPGRAAACPCQWGAFGCGTGERHLQQSGRLTRM